ncbi:MAG: metal ABC transporter permease, partial [bacterium]|nr:metal ABC transporter permease [bacterium]
RICKSFKSVIICCIVVSVLCFLIGFFCASMLSLQTGPCVVLVNLIVFIIFTFLSRFRKKTA